VRLILACTLLFAIAAGLIAAGQEREYRARAYVIQVPSDIGGDAGVALARSQRVLGEAVRLARVPGVDAAWLRDHSRVEITSRLDLVFTVEAKREDDATRLATAYAKALRAAIPDDRGLPVRGRGALAAQRELGPLGWAAFGAFAGLAVGVALALVRNGLRRGSGRASRRASRAGAPR
jgi:hypothetical protein